MKKLFILLMTVLMLLAGCQKNENINYDAALLDYDEARRMDSESKPGDNVFGFYRNESISSAGTTFIYDEESIQKGYFYITPRHQSFDDSDDSAAIVKAVYNIDYVVDDTTIRFHTFTMSFEEIDCQFHDITLTTPEGQVIEVSVSDDNFIEQKLNYTMPDNDGTVSQTMFWIKGIVTYEGQDYKFQQHF